MTTDDWLFIEYLFSCNEKRQSKIIERLKKKIIVSSIVSFLYRNCYRIYDKVNLFSLDL